MYKENFLSYLNDIKPFIFKAAGDNEQWVIPLVPDESSDAITISSNWSSTNVQGGTAPVVAFENVNNPVVNINLKIHADLFRSLKGESYNNIKYRTYTETITKFLSLIYPNNNSADDSFIVSPYIKVEWNSFVYRGYLTNVRVTQSGNIIPDVNDDGTNINMRAVTQISGQLNVVKSSSPGAEALNRDYKESGGFTQYYQ